MYKKTDSIFIITPKIGYIPELRQSGPIPNPIRVPLPLCLNMLTAGIELHEYDAKTKKVVKLTVSNLYDDNKFGTPKVAPGPAVTPMSMRVGEPVTVTHAPIVNAPPVVAPAVEPIEPEEILEDSAPVEAVEVASEEVAAVSDTVVESEPVVASDNKTTEPTATATTEDKKPQTNQKRRKK